MKTVFHVLALKELVDAHAWLEAEDKGLGIKFSAAVYTALNELALHPNRYPIIYRRARRRVIKRFRYVIIYEIKPDHIFIVSVMHTSRRPGYWRPRAAKK